MTSLSQEAKRSVSVPILRAKFSIHHFVAKNVLLMKAMITAATVAYNGIMRSEVQYACITGRFQYSSLATLHLYISTRFEQRGFNEFFSNYKHQ